MSTIRQHAPFALRALWLTLAAGTPLYILARCAIALAT